MTDRTDPSAGVRVVAVWDIFVRLFHWTLAACHFAAWYLGLFGPAIMTWYFMLGYAVLALLLLRLVWGFVGPPSARFRSYFNPPKVVLGYLRQVTDRTPSHLPGHNPVGGLYVLALLLVVAGIVVTGLIADPEDYMNVGPLAGQVGIETSRRAIVWHKQLVEVAQVMVGVHVGAIAFYWLWKREDLLLPMFTGRKAVDTHADPAEWAKAGVCEPASGAGKNS